MESTNSIVIYKVCFAEFDRFWPVCSVAIFNSTILLIALIMSIIIWLRIFKKSRVKILYTLIYVVVFTKIILVLIKNIFTNSIVILRIYGSTFLL